MRSYFRKLYTYNRWANLSLIEHVQSQKTIIPEAIKRLAHIVSAEEIWYNRIKPLKFEPLPLFEVQPFDVLHPRMKASAHRWLKLVDTISDFEEIIAYKNLAGSAFKSSMNDLLLHVANHGTYHRGQVATLMRQSGQEPFPTDYIVYIRDGGNNRTMEQ